MPATIPTQRVDFSSGGTRCAAWLTLPPGDAAHPAVMLVHGFGATHEMMLAQYEQRFAASGIATLAFDYRNTGESMADRANIFRCGLSETMWKPHWTSLELIR
jgi:predicted alpha/beta-fold hydrolase